MPPVPCITASINSFCGARAIIFTFAHCANVRSRSREQPKCSLNMGLCVCEERNERTTNREGDHHLITQASLTFSYQQTTNRCYTSEQTQLDTAHRTRVYILCVFCKSLCGSQNSKF